MSNLDKIQDRDVELFPTAQPGQLSQRDELAITREQARLARELMDYRREQSASNFARMVFGIGAVFLGGFVLLIFGAIFAAMLRPAPPPPPPVNNNCIAFCSGG